jgi:tetratricopeptide (TPR) repeat protein
MMSHLQTYNSDLVLFIEAGFIAVNQFDEDASSKLFKAAALLDPKNALPQLGVGYTHLCKLELKQASKLFSELLEKDPKNEMAKTLLGLSYALNPTETAKGEKTLEEASRSAKDPMIKNLATSALKFVNQFVKKTPTPAQSTKRQDNPRKQS